MSFWYNKTCILGSLLKTNAKPRHRGGFEQG